MLSCVERIEDFYNGNSDGAGTIASYLSGEINRTVTVNVYDYAATKPRTPYPFHFTLGGASTPNLLPEEIALCLSYFAGRNTPRSRGRLYIGPFNATALGTVGTANSRPAPDLIASLVAAGKRLMHIDDSVVDASPVITDGLFLAGLMGVPGTPTLPTFLTASAFPAATPRVNFAQFSEVGNGTTPTKKHPEIPKAHIPRFTLATGGWVDNEWDGQDRRRIAASARTTFAVV